MAELTPMMRQYVRIKDEHPDALLFFRLGDFYEMFRADALEASRLLGLTLTSRQGVPMCGVPHHAAQAYIARLISHGKRVAICEQTSLPEGKGLAEREVVEVITPGTVTQEDYLPDSNNFLLSVAGDSNHLYFAYLDVSTGELGLSRSSREVGVAEFRGALVRLQPREMILQQSLTQDHPIDALVQSADLLVSRLPDWEYNLESATRSLAQTLGVANLKAFGIDAESRMPFAAGVLIDYVQQTTRGPLRHITNLLVENREPRVGLDESTIRNLELVANMHDSSSRYSLYETIRETRTSMGSRLLRQWILAPLADAAQIQDRQSQVAALHRHQGELNGIREILGSVLDLERLTARLALGRAHAKDLVAIRTTIQSAIRLRSLVSTSDRLAESLRTMMGLPEEELERCRSLADLLEAAILDEPATSLVEGRIICEGYDSKLDRLRAVQRNSRSVLEAYVTEERERSGLTTLKVRENRVLGHFLELSRTAAQRAPEHFIRRQSLTNAERFTTERLAEIESEINDASERTLELERELFLRVRARAEEDIGPLQTLSRLLARLDAIQSFAHSATVRGYVAPQIVDEPLLQITAGRHPVVEAHLPPGRFVPNDTALEEQSRFALITGPNMAGKSTYLRQTALIVLLAQIGSFVPADTATVGVTDRIFCRVGASDNLARGESTFLVEMNEAAYILRAATERSLVIMDEIGRGTGTKDGLAIAQAIMERLAADRGPATLFATHFHELTALELPRVHNLSLTIAEESGEIVFLKRVQDGPSNNSYGLHVARLAGVPGEVIRRADQILLSHTGSDSSTNQASMHQKPPADSAVRNQHSLFRPIDLIAEELRTIDPDVLRPVDALTRIARWQQELREDGSAPGSRSDPYQPDQPQR